VTTGSQRRAVGRGAVSVVACAGVAVVVTALVGTRAHAAEEQWREVLRRAGEATIAVPYEGEILWVTDVGGVAHLERARVRNGASGLSIGAGRDLLLRTGAEDGHVVEQDGPVMPVPASGPGMDDHLERLGDKYDVVVGAPESFMDRPCTTIEVRLREGGQLREQLWIDDETGLVVRRETHEEDVEEPVRLATYLSLELGRARPPERTARMQRAEEPAHAVEEVHADGVRALREAGWHVPASLPGGYAMLGAYAVAADDGQPLQTLYGDGLYMVSVFQQPGRADWDALPAGLERVEELDWPAFEWPGATPRRIVWEAQGRMWSLVGDAPPGEMAAIAAALPRTEAPGLWERLRRGFGRMWRAMSG
jgi:hypothetical protein